MAPRFSVTVPEMSSLHGVKPPKDPFTGENIEAEEGYFRYAAREAPILHTWLAVGEGGAATTGATLVALAVSDDPKTWELAANLGTSADGVLFSFGVLAEIRTNRVASGASAPPAARASVLLDDRSPEAPATGAA